MFEIVLLVICTFISLDLNSRSNLQLLSGKNVMLLHLLNCQVFLKFSQPFSAILLTKYVFLLLEDVM